MNLLFFFCYKLSYLNMEVTMYRLGESPYEFVEETAQRWKDTVRSAIRRHGTRSAGMDPVEMLELDALLLAYPQE